MLTADRADDIKADTDYPILYIGNIADNVTPLASAYNNSARFPSSAVLVQKSYGVRSFPLPPGGPPPPFCPCSR